MIAGSNWWRSVVVCWLCVFCSFGVAAGAGTPGPQPAGSIVGVYPDPVVPDDRGEFVTVRVDGPVEQLTIRDDDGAVTVANPPTADRLRVRLSGVDPPGTEPPALSPTNGSLALANSGERLELVIDGRVVSSVRYSAAKSGEQYVRTTAGWEWVPLGATDFPVVTSRTARAQVYTFPGGTDTVLETLNGATDRILLAGYTFSDPRIATVLERAVDRGVTVRVLLDDGPVGGMSSRQAQLLDELVAAGVTVELLGGERARYRFHHPKYAVVDSKAVVLTENWKPAGVGSRSSRGWGVTIDDPRIAAGLRRVFVADSNWNDSDSWRQFRRRASFEPAGPIGDPYTSQFDTEMVHPDRTRLLVGPDNAAGALRKELSNATTTIRVIQMSIGGPDGPFTQTVVEAARRGVSVDILLSSEWYVREENRAIAQQLNRLANRSDLDLQVKLATPGDRFEKIHAKGVIIDGHTVVLGSLNWNQNAAENNREVLVVLSGESVGAYFTRVFEADWNGDRPGPLPVGALVVVGIITAIALLLARRFEFERD